MVILVHQPGLLGGFTASRVSGALGLDHLLGHAQPDPTVGRSAACGELLVGMLGGDLIAEEPRRVGAGVGDQRLVLGQLQLEVISQEPAEATFDLLSFGLWSGEPEQDIIRRSGRNATAGIQDP
jgi:hypothetical protein